MNVTNLVKMANQIGAFYATFPNHEAGVAGVASHLRRFWDPRMRREFLAYVERTGGPDLTPLVAEAVRQLEPV